MFVGGVFGYGV